MTANPIDRKASDDLVFNGGGKMERLLEIMSRLRAPDGCPWDIEQDFASIAPYTIEEAYEVADAIARNEMGELRDELGDLLFQSVYHAQMASEASAFDFADVVKSIADKMVHRHPHVFGNESRDKSAAQQTLDWEKIKAAERAAKGLPEKKQSALDGVAMGLPAMTRAIKLQNRAARVGFDWPQTEQVLDKLQEEAAELVEARDHLSREKMEEEFGDLLFVVANLARHLDIDPEAALRGCNAKFERRFKAVEAGVAKDGQTMEQASLDQMDHHWNEAKSRGL